MFWPSLLLAVKRRSKRRSDIVAIASMTMTKTIFIYLATWVTFASFGVTREMKVGVKTGRGKR